MGNTAIVKKGSTKLKFILRKLISDAGLTDIQLARALGMPNTTLNQLLNSDTLSPKIDTILPIAKYFQISLDQLVGEEPLNSIKNQDFSSITPNANDEFKEWNPDLYIKCLEITCKNFKKLNSIITAEKALSIIKEIYFYFLKRNDKKVDPEFIEWFLEHALKSKDKLG